MLIVHSLGNNSQEMFIDSKISSRNFFDIGSSNIDEEFSHSKIRFNTL